MFVSRRSFLGALLCSAPVIFSGKWLTVGNAQEIESAKKPLVKDHNSTGQAILTEGKTILATFSFPSAVDDLGGTFPVEIEPASATEAILIEPQPLYFYAAGDGRTFHTIISAPLDSVEGTHTLRLSAREWGGTISQWEFPYFIQRGIYRSSSLTLDRSFSTPPPEIAARTRREFEAMVQIYQRRTPRRWREAFMLPVIGADKNNFGERRIVNGVKHYRHAGLDFHAPYGTPVRAINDGQVVLSAEQWTPGETICLDHGGGVFSKYAHLSHRLVREGDSVVRGQVIALSGNSGGQKPPPHLHLDVIVNGTHVSPKDFMRTAAQLLVLETGTHPETLLSGIKKRGSVAKGGL